ncbi:MAG: hypothetical protein ACQERK_06425, partial [Campylobacterota bacterium]
MAKIITALLLCMTLMQGQDVFEKNCMECHKQMEVGIDKLFYRYLLHFSSKEGVQTALAYYLQNPSRQSSMMPEAFLNRYGVKEKTDLTPKQLQKALDSYWERYKVFGRLK